jgi:hypothetical protein
MDEGRMKGNLCKAWEQRTSLPARQRTFPEMVKG